MPSVENELVEADFNAAVTSYLYLFEQKRETERVKTLAQMVGVETARLLAPMWGYEVKGARGSGVGRRLASPRSCEHGDFKRLSDGQLECGRCGERGN